MLLFDLFDDSCPYSWIKICTLTRDQLLYFVFRCFDEDNSGLLSHDEFLSMANAINEAGGGFFDGNFSQLIEKFDQNNDGNVDFGEFLMVRAFVRHEEKDLQRTRGT
jgi:Ca2+-binding EF-hand superfamily protein